MLTETTIPSSTWSVCRPGAPSPNSICHSPSMLPIIQPVPSLPSNDVASSTGRPTTSRWIGSTLTGTPGSVWSPVSSSLSTGGASSTTGGASSTTGGASSVKTGASSVKTGASSVKTGASVAGADSVSYVLIISMASSGTFRNGSK